MTRKKQQKNKKTNPGVFISNLLSSKVENENIYDKQDNVKKEKKRRSIEAKQYNDKDDSDVKEVISKYQEVVLFRTVVELALVNIAIGDRWLHGQSVEKGGFIPVNMAPPSKEGVSSSGLSKLMSPVQDLGRSLLGFLIGPPQVEECPQPPAVPTRGSSLTASRNNSIVSTNSVTSPGRQRPFGHPAHPSVNSTPVVIRRTKTDKGENVSKSLESQCSTTQPTEVQLEPVESNLESKTHGNRQSVNMTPLCTPPTSSCVSPVPRPPSSKSRKKRNKKSTQDFKQIDSGIKKGSTTVQSLTDSTSIVAPKDAVNKPHASTGSSAEIAEDRCSLEVQECGGISSTDIDSPNKFGNVENHPIEEIKKNSQSSPVTLEENLVEKNLCKPENEYFECEDSTGYVTARNSVVVFEKISEENESFLESESDIKEVAEQLDASKEIRSVDNATTSSIGGKTYEYHENEYKDEKSALTKTSDINQHSSVYGEDNLTSAAPDIIGNPVVQSGPVSTEDDSFPASSRTPRFSSTVPNEKETHVEVKNFDVDIQAHSIETTSGIKTLPPLPPPPPPDGFLIEGLKIPKKVKDVEQVNVSSSNKTGTIKKNKQLSREEALLEQLSGLDDTFANFLKTQLSITVNSRERDSVVDTNHLEVNTLRRKNRKRRTDSECSDKEKTLHERPVSSLQTNSEQTESERCSFKSDRTEGPVSEEHILDHSSHKKDGASEPCLKETSENKDLSETKSSDKSFLSKERTGINTVENRLRTGSNAADIERDRPSSIVDTSLIEPDELLPEKSMSVGVSSCDSDIVPSVRSISEALGNDSLNNKSNEHLVADTCDQLTSTVALPDVSVTLLDPRASPSSHYAVEAGAHDMTRKVNRAAGDLASSTMGAIQSVEKEISRQNLSKSDSGYSGHISVDSVDETDHEDQFVKRSELTVDQALNRYNRTVGKVEPPPKLSRRTRELSEGSEYSDELSGTESDASDYEDGVTRRARDTRSYNSRRSSTDSSEDGFNQNVRDLKQEVKDLEEKFRKAMVANASLDNEKCQLMFQVDLLKDQVEEGEEQAALVVKELRAKTHDFEILKRDHAESVRAVQLLQQALNEQQAMLQERGLVLLGEGEDDGEPECDEIEQEKRTRAIVSQDTANILAGLGTGPLDVRIKRLAGQRDDLQDTVRRLKLDLEEERSRSSLARGAASLDENERETKKLIDDYKFKISKSDQEIATLGANVARLESQVIRYKTASETAELSVDNLKSDRRKMQRELRDAVTRNEELETQNKHLEKRLDKLKTAKSTLLKEL